MTDSKLHPALNDHARSGGSTYRGDQSMAGTNRWAVGVSPETARSSVRGFTPEDYDDFSAQHSDLLAQHPNSAVGTSQDQHGIHYLELVGFTPSQHAAQIGGAALGESSVFHLGTNKSQDTGHVGDRPLVPHSVSERLQMLATGDHPAEPFSGIHFSDAKLDTIDGSRRGSSGVGAESGRVRLGSQTGLGPDAPPGFHVYSANSLAEPQVAGRKNAHVVSGKFAFGSTASPEFLEAYEAARADAKAKGADDRTAHGIGANAGEQALYGAGYDGVSNPSQPSTRLVFGSHTLPSVNA